MRILSNIYKCNYFIGKMKIMLGMKLVNYTQLLRNKIKY
jgi:hypothetical protein